MDENVKGIDERFKKIEERLTRLERSEVEKKIPNLESTRNFDQDEGSGKGWGVLFIIGAALIALNLVSKLFSYGLESRYSNYSSYSIFNFSNVIWFAIAVALAYFGFKILSRKREAKKQTGEQLATIFSQEKSQSAQDNESPILNLKPEESSNLEFKIASNWFPVVGIIAIIFGFVFFLKFAFDNGWIGPTGQVTLGVIAGIVLLGIGEFFRGKYRQYSQIITGGGVVVLYLSIWAAYSLFKLVGVEVTLTAMALITVTSTLLAIRYDAIGIAALGFLGGFATPLMLSSGFGTFLPLMVYILILDVGVLSISLFKKWQMLNLFAFLLTYFDYVVWYGGNYSSDKFGLVFFFLTLIFVIFGTITFIHSVLNDKKIEDNDVVLMAINALVYFGAGLHLIHPLYRNTEGFFALILSFVYFLLGYFSFKKYSKDANLTMAFLGLSIAFLTVAIPLQVDGTAITIAWASEAAMLVYLGFYISSFKLRVAGLLIFILVAVRLAAFESFISTLQFELIANKRFLIYMFCAGSMAIASWFYKQFSKLVTEDEKPVMATLLIAFNIVVLAAISMESNSYFEKKINESYKVSGIQSSANSEKVLGVVNPTVVNVNDDYYYSCAKTEVNSNELVLGQDPSCGQRSEVGLIFRSVGIPKNAYIKKAELVFVTADDSNQNLSLRVGSNYDYALFAQGVIPASVKGTSLSIIGLESVVQNVVSQPGWNDSTINLIITPADDTSNTSRKIYSRDYTITCCLFANLLIEFDDQSNFAQPAVSSSAGIVSNNDGNGFNNSAPAQLSPYPSTKANSYSTTVSSSNMKRNSNLESARDVTLSIIWILYAIVLIVAGLIFKYKPIRLMAIALFSISVLKVFLIDSRYLQTFYRIIAFMVLGTILLTVSLIYRRYKNKIEEFLL